jgi:hypothetical protein
MFFAHSIEGRERDAWQRLDAHLQAVSRLTAARAEKFGAGRLGALVGLLHDLGKYSRELCGQARISFDTTEKFD